MRLKKMTTILVASIISAVVLAVCLDKIIYRSNHYEINVKICYEADAFEEYKMESGDTLMLLNNPVREGYEFMGWYADPEYTKEFDFDNAITKDTTIYAKMQKV